MPRSTEQAGINYLATMLCDFVWEKIRIAKERRNETEEEKVSEKKLSGYRSIRIESQPQSIGVEAILKLLLPLVTSNKSYS